MAKHMTQAAIPTGLVLLVASCATGSPEAGRGITPSASIPSSRHNMNGSYTAENTPIGSVDLRLRQNGSEVVGEMAQSSTLWQIPEGYRVLTGKIDGDVMECTIALPNGMRSTTKGPINGDGSFYCPNPVRGGSFQVKKK